MASFARITYQTNCADHRTAYSPGRGETGGKVNPPGLFSKLECPPTNNYAWKGTQSHYKDYLLIKLQFNNRMGVVSDTDDDQEPGLVILILYCNAAGEWEFANFRGIRIWNVECSIGN